MANIKKTFSVKGMSCAHCEMAVANSVRNLDGVVSAKANKDKAILEMEYDDSLLSVDEIKEAVDSTGYEFAGEK